MATNSASVSRSAAKRLVKELSAWENESQTEAGIERLGPVSDEELLHWEAVINGRGVGSGYDAGRWLLDISIPTTYPLSPPKISFRTPIVHANIALRGGDICLDLLKEAWTPAYSILECVRAVRMLLSCPETDSPLNVDVAALIRGGDAMGARRLVEFWCSDEGGRYEGR
ncbi:ubiquitin-conjugating enzyme/RWD-like protein [Daldinia loculata]|uniref:ubiquitin-conjugating enzyme/RWD-like protein n=1 Tax=Daldinia loculata TaxID=103429 RepID=UPI0020C44AAB|nr:ubiquitin-conjugating enzyme/RWD-like protein [Daldinia loculata]KAI1649766.1 ubiquitin-conjugating enzyme/RWD-like protein [Daldinia loculata]KAI2784739.1 ubiquitin-conjugating enzyme/RWD-like protein [Daldinia loculata]